MEDNQEQQVTSSQNVQDQSISMLAQDTKVYSQPIAYPKQESFFRKIIQDKQNLLLFICSIGVLIGVVNSIALIHVLSRQDRPAQYMYHNGMMGSGGQKGNFYFDNGNERGNIKRNLPGNKGKSFQFEGGTFELPGGGTIEINPGSGNSSSNIQPDSGNTN